MDRVLAFAKELSVIVVSEQYYDSSGFNSLYAGDTQ